MYPSHAFLGLAPGDCALVVGTHPDDESLGPGGTVARLAAAGITTHVLAVACPAGGRPADVRVAEFNTACDALGVARRRVAWTCGPRASAPGEHLRELVTLIESGPEVSLREAEPALLLIPAATGFHQDHQGVHRAGFAAARPGGATRRVPRIVLGYAGPEDSWTTAAELQTVYVDTTGSWGAKEKALSAYAGELRDDDHPRSISRIRVIDTAAGAAVGAGMAERFVPYRVAL